MVLSSLYSEDSGGIAVEDLLHIRLAQAKALAGQAAGIHLFVDKEGDLLSLGIGDLTHVGIALNRFVGELTLGLSKEDIEDIMHNNAVNLIEGARKSIYGE